MFYKTWYIFLVCLCLPTHGLAEPTSIAPLLVSGDFDQAATLAQQNQDHYLSELIQRAHDLKLAEKPVWKKLLHYRKSWIYGTISEVDGADFFLSKHGKFEPEKELAATLVGFFSSKTLAPSNQTAQCRFPARYHWLKQQLQFDIKRLPPQACEKYSLFRNAVQPVGMTIVFPAAHPNSPSSMFGHTLIRFDKARQTEATRMLDYTINYAAEADSAGGLQYAIKGLTGGYAGRFRMIPYYMKLREYAQMENRDIWEYKLNIAPASIDFILMHAWELLPTYFDYYFFTENCAYHLLSLMEPGLPELDLTDAFDSWVLPVDTLRLLQQRGLVQSVSFYPSRYRIIQKRRSEVTPEQELLAKNIANIGLEKFQQPLSTLTLNRQADILDLAFDYHRYGVIEKANILDAKLDDAERGLLLRRSSLAIVRETPHVDAPDIRPDQGHPTKRWSLGLGSSENQDYVSLRWRAVYHDWLDPMAGHANNFALEFGSLAARYYPEAKENEWKLDQFHLVRIDNMEPRDDFFQRISWRVAVGWEGLFASPVDDTIGFTVRGGAGLSYRMLQDRLLFFGIVEGDMVVNDLFADDVSVGLGPATGIYYSPNHRWNIALSANYLAAVTRDKQDRARLQLGQSWQINQRLSLELLAERKRQIDGWFNEVSVSAHVYY